MSFRGRIQRALARTLTREPFAIAYSGGGDSTALLHALGDRVAFAVIVDHGLSEGSAERTDLAVTRAKAMGVETVVRSWSDPDKTAQQAAARQARYNLIGETLRERGLETLLTAHTLTDAVETAIMSDGAAMIRPVTYAPVWPGLLRVDVVRPMLEISRAEVRSYLSQNGLPFIDDPANADTRFARVRARERVTRGAELDLRSEMEDWRDALHAEAVSWAEWLPEIASSPSGELLVPHDVPTALFRLALASAGGVSKLTDIRRVEALMNTGGTLGGAFTFIEPGGLRLGRDPGAILGRDAVVPMMPLPLDQFQDMIWDGRFRVRTETPGLLLSPLGGRGPKRTLPAVRKDGEVIATPLQDGPVLFESLALPRLRRLVEAQRRCG